MKKLFSGGLLFIALVTGKTHAQVKDNLSFGPILGVGHSTISGDLDGETKRKFHTAVNAGLRLTYSAHPYLGFGADLTFRSEGATVGSTTANEEIRLNLTYIRFDPKVYYFFGETGQAFRPKIGIGPSLGFFTSGNAKLYENNALVGKENASEIIKGFDIGIAGALGFNYRLRSGVWLNIDAAYTHGLANIAKDSGGENISNRSILLNVGLLFGIGSAKAK